MDPIVATNQTKKEAKLEMMEMSLCLFVWRIDALSKYLGLHLSAGREEKPIELSRFWVVLTNLFEHKIVLLFDAFLLWNREWARVLCLNLYEKVQLKFFQN